MSKFLHDAATDDYAKAIAIPWVFSENTRAKNIMKVLLCCGFKHWSLAEHDEFVKYNCRCKTM